MSQKQKFEKDDQVKAEIEQLQSDNEKLMNKLVQLDNYVKKLKDERGNLRDALQKLDA